jgi:RHS repeat-associated protein
MSLKGKCGFDMLFGTHMRSPREQPTVSRTAGPLWTYLPDGRWIERIVSTNNGSTYYPAGTNRYVWDGQVLLAILDHTNGLVMSFVRGLDLSDTIQGAGGVGGVLAVTFKTNETHFVCYDGNGNVTALADAATGANSAVFEYGPFGEPLRVTGAAAVAMPLRFSTMYEDEVTGDRKYLFREYRPSLGRWHSRDPIGQLGGNNLYALGGNDPLASVDPLGLCVGSCVAAMATTRSAMGIATPDIHKSLCTWLEGKIRGFLHSPEEISAWNRFVGGSANDIALSDTQMGSVLELASTFQAELQRQAQRCKTTSFYWFSKKTTVGDMIGGPWTLAIGGVSIDLTTSCVCRTLTWEACIFDKYNFDPEWWKTHRSWSGEAQTILVWAAQNIGQCGWKEFHHKGCKDGFIAN